MNEFEEKIIREMVLSFHGVYGYDPTTWRKHQFKSGDFFIEACGNRNENVAQTVAEGFDWMGFDTVYTTTEMTLLAAGFISYDEQGKLYIVGKLFDEAMAKVGIYES